MPQTTDKFYNLQIDLVKNGQIVSEKAAISSIIEKDGSVFFNIYIYRLDKNYVFEKHFIQKIHDLSRDKIYLDVDKFISDFYQITNAKPQQINSSQEEIKKYKSGDFLQPIYDDVIILLFFAGADVDNGHLKYQVVNEYINKKIPSANNYSQIYINKYLDSLSVSNADFYNSLNSLLHKNDDELDYLCKTLIKICLSDGRLHYTERMYLAEIMQLFRSHDRPLPEALKHL